MTSQSATRYVEEGVWEAGKKKIKERKLAPKDKDRSKGLNQTTTAEEERDVKGEPKLGQRLGNCPGKSWRRDHDWDRVGSAQEPKDDIS